MNRTVLVTGASRGLGRELVMEFARRGDRLVMCSRSPSALSKYGVYVEGDLLDSATLDRLEAACADGLDVLVNNAGAYFRGDVEDINDDRIRTVVDLNLTVPIRLTERMWHRLRKSKVGGMVVNVNSVAGLNGSPGESLYAATKFGLRGFSQSLWHEGLRDGVRVMDVFLGAMRTCMTNDRADYGRLIDPVEAAWMIAELCERKDSLQVTEVTIGRLLTR